ncbi:MAG TPA: hypothetical protein VF939_19455 [Puia sp.]
MKTYALPFIFEGNTYRANFHEIKWLNGGGDDYLVYQTEPSLLEEFGNDHSIVQWHRKEKKTTSSQYPGDKDAINLMGCLENAVRAYRNKRCA